MQTFPPTSNVWFLLASALSSRPGLRTTVWFSKVGDGGVYRDLLVQPGLQRREPQVWNSFFLSLFLRCVWGPVLSVGARMSKASERGFWYFLQLPQKQPDSFQTCT